MSNVKVVKVDSIKLGGSKKTKKNMPTNIDYLKNIVRTTKAKVESKGKLDLSNSDMITNLLNKKQSKKVEVKKAVEQVKPSVEPPKPKVETPKPKVETPKPKVETPKPKVETPKPKVETPKPKKNKNRKQQLPKKVGKKTTKKEIMSYFSNEDQKKMKKTKRDKKLISSNLVAPKIEKKTRKNMYKSAVRNILKKDKKKRPEIAEMTRNQLLKELSSNGIIEENSKAPLKILRDLYHLYLLTEVNVSK